jgi:hypothetical protein
MWHVCRYLLTFAKKRKNELCSHFSCLQVMVAQQNSKIDMFIQEFRAYSGNAGGVNGSAAGNDNTAHQGAK